MCKTKTARVRRWPTPKEELELQEIIAVEMGEPLTNNERKGLRQILLQPVDVPHERQGETL